MLAPPLAGRPAKPKKPSFIGTPPSVQSIGIPSPTKGLVANSPFYSDIAIPDAAIWLYNLIPREQGCNIRPGSAEFATNIPDATDNPGQVRTIMYYNSIVSQAAGGVDFTFAVTDKGIFDISAGGPGPWVPVFAWPNQTTNAGWCSVVNFTNAVGDHFLLVCDEDNGYYVFDGLAWAQGSVTGGNPAPENLVHVTEWDGRLWFTERDTARAWYLGVLDLAGNMTALDVGSRFVKGGHLVQCQTWTVDDGAGLNDRLVMVSSAGDVLVWRGNPDIASNPLTVLGRWYVGTVVDGRRVMSNLSGDTIILAGDGIIRVTDLMSGRGINDKSYISANIARYYRLEIATKRDRFGWQIELNSLNNIAIVSIPKNDVVSQPPIQFCLNLNAGTWCILRDLDMVCMNDTPDDFYFGTNDGRVMAFSGNADDRSLDGESATTIKFSVLTHYTSLGDATTWKRPQFVRPSWIGTSSPSYNLQIRYDFDVNELLVSPPFSTGGVALWDEAIWGTDRWADSAQSFLETIGVSGMGRHVAIAVYGETRSPLSLVGFDLMGDSGGML